MTKSLRSNCADCGESVLFFNYADPFDANSDRLCDACYQARHASHATFEVLSTDDNGEITSWECKCNPRSNRIAARGDWARAMANGEGADEGDAFHWFEYSDLLTDEEIANDLANRF